VMQYLGGKSRLARKIVDVIRERAPETLGVIEPFCGGCAVTEKLCAWRPTLASDAFPGLVDMLVAVRQGLRLPVDGVTDQEYRACKALAAAGNRDPMIVAIGFGLSFGGKWYGGLTRPPTRYAGHWNRWADRLAACRNLILQAADYRDYSNCAGPGVTFYCDPPYRGTEGYETGAFDSAAFDSQCLAWRRAGARVFVSEFEAPWTVVVEIPRTVAVDNSSGGVRKTCIDRLYEVEP
jgi:site-specific DNA-adenine methylase